MTELRSDPDRTASRSRRGPHVMMTSGCCVSMARLSWKYAPQERLLVTNRVAFLPFRSTRPQFGLVRYVQFQELEFLYSRFEGPRPDSCQRTGLRINKALGFRGARLTPYSEVVNLLNRPDCRCDSCGGGIARAGQALVNFGEMFPVPPPAGTVLGFEGARRML